jgi:hypothetical protein
MQVTRLINASAERVWEVLIDTQLWPVWGPSVQQVDCAQRYISAGVSGRIKTAIGLWADFKITEYDQLSYWGWKVAGVPATGHRLRRLNGKSCELIFELPFVAFPYALICRQALNKIARLAEDTNV